MIGSQFLINLSEVQDQGCIFCNLKKSFKVIHENEYVYAIYDEFPASPGHALIIPKMHIANWFDLDVSIQKSIIDTLNLTKKEIEKEFSPDAYNIGVNCGKEAGQTVHHVHLHLIPRYKNDVEDPTGGVRAVIPEKKTY